MTKKIIEGLWDCPYCDQKGIGGLTKQCPGCGHPQDEGTVFYLPSRKKYLDKEKSDQYGKGADWICSYCQSLNRYSDEVCRNCGSAREEMSGDYFSNKSEETAASIKHEDVYGNSGQESEYVHVNPNQEEGDANADPSREGEVYYDNPDQKGEDSHADSSQKQENEPAYKKYQKEARAKRHAQNKKEAREKLEEHKKRQAEQKQSRMKLFGGIGIALVLILLFAFWPRTASVRLDHKNWTRDISIEEYKTVKESGWTVPEGGRTYDTKSEIHHYDSVLDHYEDVQVAHYREVQDGYDTSVEYVDNGDGTFSEKTVQTPRYRTETYYETESQPVYRDVAVYQTKYYYEIERWTTSRHVTTQGTDDEPFWGEVVLEKKEREGDRTESYTLVFAGSKGKSYTADVGEDYWNSMEIGTSVKITSSNGKVTKINGEKIK